MYRIQGADQKEYGPITADQIRGWVLENRLNRFSLCAGADGVWKPLGQFLEFKELLAQTVAGPGGAGAGGGGAVGAVGYSGGGMDQEAARRRVQAPAICLMVLAGVAGLMSLSGPITKKAQMEMLPRMLPQLPDAMRQEWARQAAAGFGIMDIVSLLIVVVLCGVVILGATKLRRLESFGWSATAAILTMLPCTGCCCGLGLAAGIWALLTINAPEVKRHFTR